jgi:hypothetical protein
VLVCNGYDADDQRTRTRSHGSNLRSKFLALPGGVLILSSLFLRRLHRHSSTFSTVYKSRWHDEPGIESYAPFSPPS